MNHLLGVIIFVDPVIYARRLSRRTLKLYLYYQLVVSNQNDIMKCSPSLRFLGDNGMEVERIWQCFKKTLIV